VKEQPLAPSATAYKAMSYAAAYDVAHAAVHVVPYVTAFSVG